MLAEETASSGLAAADVMTRDLCAVGPDAGFYEASQVTSENGVRLLVCTEETELVGIMTGDDLTELLADEQQLASVIQAQRPSD